MDTTNIQKILSYYLEYEINHIISSSQIKVNNKTSMMIDIHNEKEVRKTQNNLKEIKITEKIEKIIGKKVNNKKELVSLIKGELANLNEQQSNKAQIFLGINNVIKENFPYKKEEKTIENFVDELCKIKTAEEFLIYTHTISVFKAEAKKLPLFIFKCKIENEKIKVMDIIVNVETLNTILSVIYYKEIADVVLEYKEKILNYSKEVKNTIDGGDIQHILKICYSKLKDYVGIAEKDIKEIARKNAKYNMNQEYIMSLDELTEEAIKNIKEDIELLKKLIKSDNYVPNLLNKYLNGSSHKKDINNSRYSQVYRGNYKNNFGVGQNQYKIVNTIKDNELIAIEGPPGTGKTSLLKEIIANKIVERATLIAKNWNKKLACNKYGGVNYYDIDWYSKDKDTIKSIVVSSKNGEAIENVGKEINQEIEYMSPVAKKYKRTQLIKNEKHKILQDYKGIICLPLGKQDNVQDFKEFLYQEYIPMLDKLQTIKYEKEKLDEVKEKYENKCKQVKEYEQFIDSFKDIKDEKTYFYGIEIAPDKEDEKKIQEIQKLFIEDKKRKQINRNKLEDKKDILLEQKKKQKEKLFNMNKNIKHREQAIKSSQQKIVIGNNDIQNLRNQQEHFDKIKRNIFTKILNLKEYRKNKSINFFYQINEIEIANKIEEDKISQYNKDKSRLEMQKDKINDTYDKINKEYENLINQYHTLNKEIQEMELIEQFNKKDKKTYWHYSNRLEMYGKSSLNTLNQELFELALALNEAYIVKNSEQIANNLKLFLPDKENAYICQKFYESTEILNKEQQKGIKCLWSTLFLCFPVVTTTLDSFGKRCFHLIPEYIDLELIDEAGQILPHNLVTALYRAKKAVIVGDINQIEPIYNQVNKDFGENKKSIGKNFETIKIEENSIQSLANKNTDILNNENNIILNDHYRCEKNIINFSNENVYGNKLNMHIKDKMDKPFSNNMIALDVRGKKTEEENENQAEVESCIEVIKYIKEQSKKEVSIAVITPFKKQKAEIENRLKQEQIKDVNVGTVHAFQGQEKDYIIFSSVIDSVKPKWAINFIGKKCNMLNVAVSRAKKQFIYLGNLNVAMQAGNYMEKLIKYINKNGLIYSLYNLEDVLLSDSFDEKILKILQPELKLENDNIGFYIQQHIKSDVMTDAKQHYDFLKYVMKNVKKEIYIMSPWIKDNVMNEEFLKDVRKLKEKNCIVKIVFGYKKGNKNISGEKELAMELKRTDSLGYATEEVVGKIAKEMYQIIGKENFIYNPPTHAKVLIIDDKYMCIGSHNWLSNAGKTNEQERPKEGTKITTSKSAIEYVKKEFFN